MEWIEYAKKIKKVLDLEGSPVAVTYSLYPPKKKSKGKLRVCNAFLAVSKGKIIDLTAETSACGGGTLHLGLGDKFTGEAAKALKEFLTKGEKIYCDIAALHRAFTLSTQPPLGLAEHIVMSPMEKAEFKPDVVLFICNGAMTLSPDESVAAASATCASISPLRTSSPNSCCGADRPSRG